MRRYRIAKADGILLNVLTRQGTEVYGRVVDGDISHLEVEGDDLWVVVKDGSRHLTSDHAEVYVAEGWIVSEEPTEAD